MKKPTLLEIARQVVLADDSAKAPWELISTLECNWVAGAKKYGIPAQEFPGENFDDPVANAVLAFTLLDPEFKLGDVIKYKGQKLVLIANITEGDENSKEITAYAAFVAAEDIEL